MSPQLMKLELIEDKKNLRVPENPLRTQKYMNMVDDTDKQIQNYHGQT